MKRKIWLFIIVLMIGIGIYAALYIYGVMHLFPNPPHLTEKEISIRIQNSFNAFQKETFQKKPFEKVKEFEAFTDFLTRNADTIFSYQPNKKYQVDHCTYYSNKIDGFIENYIPPHLQKEFKQHLNDLGDLIISFKLCDKNDNSSTQKQIPSLEILLKYSDITNSEYIILHSIDYNKPIIRNKKIPKELEGDSMLKDSLLSSSLHYIIEVFPIKPE